MTETDKIIKMLNATGMTFERFLQKEIEEWQGSDIRKKQIEAKNYYAGLHDIRFKNRKAIGADKKEIIVENLPNNRVMDNQYGKMVDQKTNYLFSKPYTLSSQNENYTKGLQDVLDKKFRKTIKNTGKSAINQGIAFVYVYLNSKNQLCFRLFETEECLPYWTDSDHEELEMLVRVYDVVSYEGEEKKTVQKVEVYEQNKFTSYDYEDGTLKNKNASDYMTLVSDDEVKTYNWQRIPIIAFKNDSLEQPLLNRCKSLQDGMNEILSKFKDNMDEDARNTVVVIRGYGKVEASEFRRNLATYGAIILDDASGGVETLNVEVNADNYKAIYEIFRKALIENCRGLDAKDDRMSGNPNQMNIQSMYSDLDLDANGMEAEFQQAFDELLFFVDAHLENLGKGSFKNEEVTLTFNRNVLINETETINNCSNSLSLLSENTVLEKHPWVVDVETEIERKKSEEPEVDPYANPITPVGGDEGGEE